MAKAPCLSSEAESARGTIDSCADHKPLMMHEPARWKGRRRGDREASIRDEIVFCVRILGTAQIRSLIAFASAVAVTI
jgi:hypothetical protein